MVQPGSAGTTDAEQDGLPTPRRHIAMLAIIVAITLVVLDGAIANVALPTIAVALKATPGAAVWVVTGYQMAVVMALLPCAALGESIGFARVYLSGVALFTVASALCAVAPTLDWLIAARFLQGLGASAIMSLGLALLRYIFPRHLLGTAIGLNAVTVALGGAAGPSIGAAILSVANWSWLFTINLPISLIVFAAGRSLPRIPGSGRPIDAVSAALNAGVFALLILGIDYLPVQPLIAMALLAVSLGCLVALIRRELPHEAPLIPLDLLREAPFRISVIASVCCFAGQAVSLVALPFYLAHAIGADPIQIGLYMTPWPLTVAIAAPISGRLSDRFSTAWLCAAGGICLATGLLLAAVWPVGHSPLPLVLFTIMSGLGFGFFQTPNNRNMLLTAPKARSGAAGGAQATARLLGQTIGSVAMTVLFTLLPTTGAPRIGLAVGAALALAAGLISTLRAATPTNGKTVMATGRA